MNFRFIINIFGRVLILLSILMATNLVWAFVYCEDTVWRHIFAIITTLLAGFGMFLFTRAGISRVLSIKDSYFTVTFVWVVMSIFGGLPYFFTGSIEHIPDIIFEAFSGFTTTGSSILIDIEALPKSILYWRSLTHWLGGMGIIVLVVAIFPLLRIGGYNLLKSETSSISGEKLAPKTAVMAKSLWAIYVVMTFVQVGLLMLGDISFFDALNHAFSAIATGGFSTKNNSITNFSPYVQYVLMLFMFLSGINYFLHYHLINGKFRRVFKNTELRVYTSIVFLSGVIIALIIGVEKDMPLEKAFRESFFQVISVVTTTGLFTVDYLEWSSQAWILLFLLTFVGGCVGSTGGGVKVIRHVVSIKSVMIHFRKMLHPNSVQLLKINNEIIDDDKVSSLISFLVLYLLTIIAGTIAMVFLGEDLLTAVGAVSANMGGVGIGIGTVGPAGNYAHIHDAGKILLSFLMLIGRLEMTTVLILFTRIFWKE
ncbi:MAG: TrkH family potassium uptake protein [Cytophagaceae bacterium]|nr:TrkH family potassium uptake protein [Cytophagaceae bacterium]